jgi:hypothetical protein
MCTLMSGPFSDTLRPELCVMMHDRQFYQPTVLQTTQIIRHGQNTTATISARIE